MVTEILLALWGEGSEEEQWPLLAPLSGESGPSSPHPDAGQFSSPPYVPGASRAAAPALELRGSESE